MTSSCAQFEIFVNFQAYIETIRNVLGPNITVKSMQVCKTEICTTLYSTGNPDVSGIGVIVGYYLEFALGALLAVTLLLLQRSRLHKYIESCRTVTAVFADAAIALALAVELASAITLIKREFGLGSYDFGALTIQLDWVVALLVMLPITTFCWHDLRDKKFELRICVIALVFVLFLITFVCRMISTYSHREIGSGKGAVITNAEANQIDLLCLSQARQLSSSASTVMEVFSIGGSLWTSCLIAAALLRECVHGLDEKALKRFKQVFRPLQDEKTLLATIVIAMLVWSVPLFWIMMKLRSLQEGLAADLGQPNDSAEWSFGQILAVVVFVPVLVEMLNQYLQRWGRPDGERRPAFELRQNVVKGI